MYKMIKDTIKIIRKEIFRVFVEKGMDKERMDTENL